MRLTTWAFALCFAAIAIFELAIPFYHSDRLLKLDYGVLDGGGGGMALSAATDYDFD